MSQPAPAPRAVVALAGHELRLTLRRGENVLVTIAIPAAVLLFFASTGFVATGPGRPVDFLLPGAIALAIIATGMVNLGIATGYERSYGVLKRLGAAPLPRWGLMAAKTSAVVVLETAQVLLLIAIAAAFLDWRPAEGGSVAVVLLAVVLGTVTFAGLGLAMAGGLRPEATLALANALFLVFLLLGGIILPVDRLPAPLSSVAALLPSAALAEALRAAFGAAVDAGPAFVVLVVWAVVAATLAVRAFRWD